MQFNIVFKTIFEYIHKKFRFMHTNTFCKYRKKLLASPRVHLVADDTSVFLEGTEYSKFIKTLNNELENVTKWLNANRLTVNIKQDAREAMRVVFFCTHKTYLYAQNEISYEYTQILF